MSEIPSPPRQGVWADGRSPFIPPEIRHIIAGTTQHSRQDAHRIAVINPATEREISVLHEDTAADVDRAVGAAHYALRSGPWGRMEVAERAACLRDMRAKVQAHAEELAYLECIDTGVPLTDILRRKMPRLLDNFEFAANLASTASGETYQQNSRYLSYVTRDPVGIVAIVAPWNSPMVLASMQFAPCIAFGNACIIKPSEHAPLSLWRLVQLIHEAGLPPGVVNLVNGRGGQTGEALVRHPDVAAIKFVGGTETGKRIMAAAAPGLKGVGLELGGKSANIVMADADFDDALDGALLSIFSNNGQQCLAGSRILVQRSIAPAFMDAFVSRTAAIRVGDPLDSATEVGPLAFEEHYNKVRSYVDVAEAEGARLMVGGKRPDGLDRGYFFAPTAVLAQSNESRVCQEEIFGPFATFLIFDEIEDAIRIANQSRFGLVAYIWSRDLDKVMRISQAVRAGTVLVNTSMVRELCAPFGGFNESGVGRDGARHSLDFFTETRTTTIPLGKVAMRKLGMAD